MNTDIKWPAILLALAVLATGCTNVRQVGKINGLDVTRITTRGVFSPSTTTIVVTDPEKPKSIEGVLANGQGPGFVPSVAQAGGIAGGAALLRPSKTKVENNNGGANAAVVVDGGDSINNHQNGAIHHNVGNGNGQGNQ